MAAALTVLGILLIIVATIMLIDILSEAFRHSAIGRDAFAR